MIAILVQTAGAFDAENSVPFSKRHGQINMVADGRSVYVLRIYEAKEV